MYKVFFKDRVIIITDRIDETLSPEFNSILKYSNTGELMNFIAGFEYTEKIHTAYIYGYNEWAIFHHFRSCFKNLLAAGGVVWDSGKEHILVMKRLGVFDLPKGKVERGETFADAVLREVHEECGISALSIIRKIAPSFHTYRLNDKLILKETQWFEMVNREKETLIAQKEENIEQLFWMHPSHLSQIIPNTYPSIAEILNMVCR